MLTLTMLPARQGDCLWISYGEAKTPRHLVIDGGPEGSKVLRRHVEQRLGASSTARLSIDVLVVTHIDNDHIGGVLDLVENWPDGLTVGDIWFNGEPQLFNDDLLGPAQGERLSKALESKACPWNVRFDGQAVIAPSQGALPRIGLPDGLFLTILGPGQADLDQVKAVWSKVLAGEEPRRDPKDLLGRKDPWPPAIEKLAASPFQPDTGAANGSSIALLLEYDQRRILLAADAYAQTLAAALDRLPFEEELIWLSAFKLSHHGSKKSTSTQLLERVRCGHYLISTDGSYSGHPDPEAVARVLKFGGPDPELIFNSSNRYACRWNADDLKRLHRYRTRYPKSDAEGVVIEL